MDGCSALVEREKEMRKPGGRADNGDGFDGKWLRPAHGINPRGAQTKGKHTLKQNPNVAFSLPKLSPTLLRFFLP